MSGNTWALALAAGALTMTIAGGVALASFQPSTTPDHMAQSILADPAANVVERDQPKDRIKAALDALVAKGTITQGQADAVLLALKGAAPSPKPKQPVGPKVPNIRSFSGDLTRAASTYLGLSQKELAVQLRSGKSIADIANGLSARGKSATDLIALLTKTANDKVDQAVAANKLTADQAVALKPRIATQISSFVQRRFSKPEPRPIAPLRPTPSPRP